MRKGPSGARLVRPDRRDQQEVEAGMAFMDAAAHRREVADFLKICTEMPRVEFNHRRDFFQEFDVRSKYVHNIDMDLIDKIRNFIVNDLGRAEERASVLAPIWAKALNSTPQPAIDLPDSAPEIYAKRKVRPDLGRKENPIEFLERVWGGYMRAGILYQDDIKRFGDDKLVQAVRSYCQKQSLSASEHLPPPRSARIDNLAKRTDSPVVHQLIGERMAGRERNRRFRERTPKLDS